ncbi:hexosaminidase [Chitinophaga polysaccharea]|uniref:beta-N-acetylhexosaminidase n=1 Tax=Chitinophaga polysaccharea TaxID=1293035 RepID=A0A561PXK1_9BACT|nr:family 20 glycosylhydrolase [Chitinophaga polysaccharea]TWF42808.1 hexosaminidase [Chitinophaga polysaccharea]
MYLFSKTMLVLCLLLPASMLRAQLTNPLIPIPVEMHTGKGAFTISRETAIAADTTLRGEAALLREQLTAVTGYPLPLVSARNTGKAIRMQLNTSNETVLGTEGYRLNITPAGVSIRANTPVGIFYGAQSLLQLLPPAIERRQLMQTALTLPAVSVTDYPRFGWRGLMLDDSRHFFSKSFVKKYIDQMAKYKFNVFHWHLTDDPGWRLAIQKYPQLTEVGAWRVPRTGRWGTYSGPAPGERATDGGFYSAEDIREIVQYAAARHVTIVPEIDVPGHSGALIAAFPEVSCKHEHHPTYPGSSEGPGDNVLCAGEEKSFVLLDSILGEVAALFPGSYIHIGGDEVDKSFWKQCPKCQQRMKQEGLKDEHELQSYFIKRVSRIVERYGKKLIGWDEILEGGLAPGAAVMSWRGPEGGIAAGKAGHAVVMTPLQFCYLDYLQTDWHIEQIGGNHLTLTDTYRFEPVPEEVDPAYILGGQGNLWTEFIASPGRAEYMTWPRAFALAEVLWSPKKERVLPDFLSRVEKHFVRLSDAGVNYAPAIYDPQVRTQKNDKGALNLVLFTEAPDLELYYTFEGVRPDQYASKYTGTPVAIPAGASDVKVVTYRNGKQMGRVLSINIKELH